MVRPYPFDFVCHVKKRLEGLDVVDMFAREFPARPKTYYQAAHEKGLLRVEPMPNAKINKKSSGGGGGGDGKSGGGGKGKSRADGVGGDAEKKNDVIGDDTDATTATATEPLRPLCAGERVRHALHRHEPPALDHPVTVVAETPDVVAIHKPATVPARGGGIRGGPIPHHHRHI